MKPNLVDVAMVTYNHCRFIGEAIESVLAQETNFRCRLVVGDDCSTDGTQELIRNYHDRFPDRIKTILYETHQGVYGKNPAWWAVLRQCTAPYFAVLDGDDYWIDVAKLQKQVDLLEANPDLSLCFHPTRVLNETGETTMGRLVPPHPRGRLTLDDLLEELTFIASNTVLYRNVVLTRPGGFFENPPAWYFGLALGDVALHVLHGMTGDFGFIEETMSVYRQHGGGVWSSQGRIRQTQYLIDTLQVLGLQLGLQTRRSYTRGLIRLYHWLAWQSVNQGQRLNAFRAGVRALRLAVGAEDRRTALSLLFSTLPTRPGLGLGKFLVSRLP